MGVRKGSKPPSLGKRITKLRDELDTLSHAIREELDWRDKLRDTSADHEDETVVSWIRRDPPD